MRLWGMPDVDGSNLKYRSSPKCDVDVQGRNVGKFSSVAVKFPSLAP